MMGKKTTENGAHKIQRLQIGLLNNLKEMPLINLCESDVNTATSSQVDKVQANDVEGKLINKTQKKHLRN